MPGRSGAAGSSKGRPTVPVIVITAFGSMESAIAAIGVGAYDFLTNPSRSRRSP
jgi:DNA-binding NtrC family response regulator